MPPVKDEKTPTQPVNTSAQIQQIFSEIQSQLPSVNFDNDDHNDDHQNDDEDDVGFEKKTNFLRFVFHLNCFC